MNLSHILGTAASSIDRAIVRAATWNTQRSTPRVGRLSHQERVTALAGLGAITGDVRYWATPELFFPVPEPIQPRCEPVRDLGTEGGVFDASWPSEYTPILRDTRETYQAQVKNRVAHARLFLAKKPRPALIAVHGYLSGSYGFEERAFPVRWFVRRGFDVALFVLPFHAYRADRPGAPLFPGADPRFTIEGCRQAIHDIRGLLRFLLARGAPSVGVLGMSLGGYVTSLLTTLEPSLSFAAPIIPLASFADFARDQGRFGEGARGEEQYRAYDKAMAVVSPLSRPSKVLPERILILAAEHDRVTPMAHAERLAAHFHAPLVAFPGGHVLQFGRREGYRELRRMWERLGLSHHVSARL